MSGGTATPGGVGIDEIVVSVHTRLRVGRDGYGEADKVRGRRVVQHRGGRGG